MVALFDAMINVQMCTNGSSNGEPDAALEGALNGGLNDGFKWYLRVLFESN